MVMEKAFSGHTQHHASVMSFNLSLFWAVNSSLIDLWTPADIVTLRATLYLFPGSAAVFAKANKLIRGVWREAAEGRDCDAACDAYRSCQDQEQHVGLMTRQRWSGKLIPSP